MSSSPDMWDHLKNPPVLLGLVSVALLGILAIFVANSNMESSHQFVAFVIMVGVAINAIWAVVGVSKKEVDKDSEPEGKD
jgi:hypothetical protein